jgi:hypothetical protein
VRFARDDLDRAVELFLPERLDRKGCTGSAADDEDVGVRSVVGRDLDCRRGRLPSLSDGVGVGVDVDGRAIGLDLVNGANLVRRKTVKETAACADRRLTLKLCSESIPGASSMSPLLQTSALEMRYRTCQPLRRRSSREKATTH